MASITTSARSILRRYVDEFTFRLNEGNVKRHTLRRLDSFVDGTAGKRLTYKALIAMSETPKPPRDTRQDR